MNDLDTGILDTRIKDLLNSAVDLELTGHRSAPPLDRSRLAERTPLPSPVTRWSLPVLAASVTALLAVGTVVAISSDRERRSARPGSSSSPAPSASPSISKSVELDPKEAARAYSEALTGAREASEVAGVSAEPLTAEEAAKFKDSGMWSMPGPAPKAPAPGKSYPITIRYLAGPGDDPVAILSGELREVASGSCPEPFLVRPGHAYSIRCQVTFLAGLTGKLTFAPRTPEGTPWTYTFTLTEPAGKSASPSPSLSEFPSLDRQPPTGCPLPYPACESKEAMEAAIAAAYSKALAGAREATEVVGVSVGPESTQAPPGYTGLGGPFNEFSGKTPTPGKSYPFMVEYLVASGEVPVAVLSLELHNVASGSCPGPFLARPAHTYRIRCQVTFRTTAAGKLEVFRHDPTGLGSQTTPLIEFPDGP